jgi:hypothetical protein
VSRKHALGHMQEYYLVLLAEKGPWSRRGPWSFGEPNSTVVVMESLLRRGLVTEKNGVYTLVEKEN